jgi:hypothetical protein
LAGKSFTIDLFDHLQYIFIPVLPGPLLHYCCAPMPFIVGVHASCLPALETMPLEETVFVDLDVDTVVGEDDTDYLPPNIYTLKSRIKLYVYNGKSKPRNGIL